MENIGITEILASAVVFAALIRNVLEVRRLRRENGKLREMLQERKDGQESDFWRRYCETAPKK